MAEVLENGSESSDPVKQEKTQLLEILQTVCNRLEQLGEEAVVMTTIDEDLFGTPRGLRFFANSRVVHTEFMTWCHGEGNQLNNHVTSVVTKEEVIGENGSSSLNVEIVDHVPVNPNSNNESDISKGSATDMETVETHADKGIGTDDIDDDVSDSESIKTINDDDQDAPMKQEEQNGKKDFTDDKNKMYDLIKKTITRLVFDKDKTVELVFPEEAGINMMEAEVSYRECFKCRETFISLTKLREHLNETHSIKFGYTCVCGKFFSDGATYQKHITSRNFKPLHLFCDKCEILFEENSVYDTHNKDVHGESSEEIEQTGTFTCEKCESVFKHKFHLVIHEKKLTDCVEQLKPKQSHIVEINKRTVTFEKDGENITKTFKQLVESQSARPFICVVCNSQYNIKSNFIRHLTSHAGSSNIICDICGVRFKGREGLTRHIKEHFNKPYNCEHCRQRFKTGKQLLYHVHKYCRGGDRDNFRCDICDHVAANMSALEKHKNVHTGLRAFECDICKKKVSTLHSLVRHMVSMHSEETPFPCDMCTKAFKTRDNLRKHKRTHEKPKYHCEECGKSCTELGNLKKHMMSHTKEKPFVCEVCGKAYGRNSLLENHRRIHTGEKPYTCTKENCDKSFRSYANLHQHIRTHSATSPYICDICGKTFKQPGRLNHHRKDHTIAFRWSCMYCQSKFKSMFMYKNHLAKTHPEMKEDIEEKTNIRLYKCDLCQKMYGDKEDLTRHVYIHNGLKPFECSICKKGFNDKSNMKQHEKTHTVRKSFTCEICDRQYAHEKTYKSHKKTCPEIKVVPMPLHEPHVADHSHIPVAGIDQQSYKENTVIICDDETYHNVQQKYITISPYPSTVTGSGGQDAVGTTVGATMQLLTSTQMDASTFSDGFSLPTV